MDVTHLSVILSVKNDQVRMVLYLDQKIGSTFVSSTKTAANIVIRWVKMKFASLIFDFFALPLHSSFFEIERQVVPFFRVTSVSSIS